MAKSLNFDLFLQEKNNDTVDVTIFGKVYKVPAKIPAIVPVMMARSEESLDSNKSVMMIMRAADAMLGSSAVNEICANGISSDEMVMLIQNLFQSINGVSDDDSESEELTDEDSRKVVSGSKRPKK